VLQIIGTILIVAAVAHELIAYGLGIRLVSAPLFGYRAGLAIAIATLGGFLAGFGWARRRAKRNLATHGARSSVPHPAAPGAPGGIRCRRCGLVITSPADQFCRACGTRISKPCGC
jgi:hypothetical protein